MQSDPLKQLKKAPWWVPVASLALLLWIANWIFVNLGFQPFLYCWGLALGPFIYGWYQMVLLIVGGWFVWNVYRKNIGNAIWSGAFFGLAFGLPEYWRIAVGLGGTCQ